MSTYWVPRRKSAPIPPEEGPELAERGREGRKARHWTRIGMVVMRDKQSGMSLRRFLMASFCGALLALPIAASAQQAQDDDEDTFEQKIIKNILGGMGVDVGRPGIDYRERSPLVIPPTRDLPPPQAAGAATRNAAWPRDPERNTVRVTRTRNARATADDPGSESVLTPDELRRGVNPRAPRVTDPSQNTGSIEEANQGRQMSPTQLNSKGIFNWDALMGTHLKDQGKFESEPSRSALTQPPPGYQTPSSAYPYGAGKDTGTGWKIPTVLDRPVGNEQ